MIYFPLEVSLLAVFMETSHKTKSLTNWFAIILFSSAFLITTITFVFAPHPYIDNAWCIALILILGYFVKYQKINYFSASLLLIAILLHMAGVFGLYSKFVFGILGFDKVLHFFATFSITYGLLDYMHNMRMKNIFAPLIALGAASIIEVSEFIGTFYFGINAGGITAIGDNLPEIRSALQTYDVYFDFISNLLGASLALIIVNIHLRIQRPNKRFTD
jgi:hypothetical protein